MRESSEEGAIPCQPVHISKVIDQLAAMFRLIGRLARKWSCSSTRCSSCQRVARPYAPFTSGSSNSQRAPVVDRPATDRTRTDFRVETQHVSGRFFAPEQVLTEAEQPNRRRTACARGHPSSHRRLAGTERERCLPLTGFPNLSGDSAQLAWNNQSVVRNQTRQVARGLEALTEAVTVILKRLPTAELDPQEQQEPKRRPAMS